MRRIATLGKNSKVDHAEQKKVGIEVVRSLEQDEVTLLKESWEVRACSLSPFWTW